MTHSAESLQEISLTSERLGSQYQQVFEDVETYCMFIGIGRTGSTLTGSLLDAHPNMIIGNELDVMFYLNAGFNRTQLYYLLLENSQQAAAKGRIVEGGGGYSYQVPNQWQGKFKKLQVIGEKFAYRTTKQLQEKPWLLQNLCQMTGIKIRLINSLRNPYDVITTISKRNQKSIKWAIELYFLTCQTVHKIKQEIEQGYPFDICVLDLKNESLIKSPRTTLKQLCCFLNVDVTDDYLDNCGSIVYQKPHKSRYDGEWNDELIKLVSTQIERFPFLYGYSYDEVISS